MWVKCWEWIKKWYRKLFVENTPLQGYVAHQPHGWITIFLFIVVHPLAGVLWGVGFIVFEHWQRKAHKDKPYQDLAGWLLGMAEAGIGYWIYGMIGN